MAAFTATGLVPKQLVSDYIALNEELYSTASVTIIGTNMNNLAIALSNDGGSTWTTLTMTSNSANTLATGSVTFSSASTLGIKYKLVGLNAELKYIKINYG